MNIHLRYFNDSNMQNSPLIPISQIIASTMPANVQFKPREEFYQTIGINKHRFAKILRGKIEPNRVELYSISQYFKIPAESFLK